MGIKEETMADNQKEIVLKADARVEKGEWGNKIGIYGQGQGDAKPYWYNTTEKKIGDPAIWEDLCTLKKGERLNIIWSLRKYPKTDGTQGETRDLLGVDRVIRSTDEPVPPPSGSPRSDTRDTPPAQSGNRDDIIAKQTCLKAGAEIVAAQIRAGVFGELSTPDEVAVGLAHKLFASLKAAW